MHPCSTLFGHRLPQNTCKSLLILGRHCAVHERTTPHLPKTTPGGLVCLSLRHQWCVLCVCSSVDSAHLCVATRALSLVQQGTLGTPLTVHHRFVCLVCVSACVCGSILCVFFLRASAVGARPAQPSRPRHTQRRAGGRGFWRRRRGGGGSMTPASPPILTTTWGRMIFGMQAAVSGLLVPRHACATRSSQLGRHTSSARRHDGTHP